MADYSTIDAINGAPLSNSTKDTYINTLGLLGTLLEFNPDHIPSFRKRMNDAEDSYDAIKYRWPDPATRCRVLTTILAVIRLTNIVLKGKSLSTWKHIHFVLTRNNSRRTGKLSLKEEKAWVPFKEIVAKREQLARTEFGSMTHLFLAWYTLWPPNRSDFDNTIIYENESDVPSTLRRWMYFKPPFGNGVVRSRSVSAVLRGGGGRAHGGSVHSMSLLTRSPDMPKVNFIVLRPETPREWNSSMPRPTYVDEWDAAPRLILLDHKTAGTHGRILRSLPIRLAEVLEASLYDYPRNRLFLRSDGEPFASSHSFTVWGERLLEKLFEGRRLGFNGLRHSYISNVSFDQSSPQQLAGLARDMGHSEFQQRRYTRGVFNPGRAPVLKEKD